jgi:hypothetical protein
MGYIRHHAIVVTGHHQWLHDDTLPNIFEAHEAALASGCRLVTPVVGPGVNGTSSFLVAPDGSKEGWDDSDAGDTARDLFIEWLRARGEGGYYAWAEVVLGSDDQEALVERHAWQFESADG